MVLPANSLFDPPTTGPISVAADWVATMLTGTIATATAVLAIAAVGFLMLRGRIDWRRGGLAILGCFVLFGAGNIANGLHGREPIYASSAPQALPTAQVTLPSVMSATPEPSAYDPYAGAAVPRR